MSLGVRSQAEVRELHEFFVDWFNAAVENTDGVFRRVESALHRDFSMVLPSGTAIVRETVLQQIRSAHGNAGDDRRSGIEIVEIVTHTDGVDSALVSYEERQFAGGALHNRRTSTAYFVVAPDAPNGVQWRRLHETLITEG